MGVKRGGLPVSKERGDIKKGGWKLKRGVDTPLHTMISKGAEIQKIKKIKNQLSSL